MLTYAQNQRPTHPNKNPKEGMPRILSQNNFPFNNNFPKESASKKSASKKSASIF
jgi:hypothetical protein